MLLNASFVTDSEIQSPRRRETTRSGVTCSDKTARLDRSGRTVAVRVRLASGQKWRPAVQAEL